MARVYKIICDLDNTTVDFDGGMRKYLQDNCPWFVLNPEGTRRNLWFEEDYLPEQRHAIRAAYCSRGFFANLPPMEGAIKAIWEMRECGLDPMFCSFPLPQNPWCADEKRQWIDRSLDSSFHYLTAEDKTMVDGDIIIDDCPNLNGERKPSWKHVFYSQIWNLELPGPRITSWPNWKATVVPLLTG